MTIFKVAAIIALALLALFNVGMVANLAGRRNGIAILLVVDFIMLVLGAIAIFAE